MNWVKLFSMQSQLDQRINYEGTDRLEHKFSALLVETAEAWNETRDFKFWSKKYKQPNTKAVRVPAMMEEDKQYYNPLLDELSDMHHFIMSIGLEIQDMIPSVDIVKVYEGPDEIGGEDISGRLKDLMCTIRDLESAVQDSHAYLIEDCYEDLVYDFLALVETLGFTGEQLEQAYYEKNQINFARQANGY